MCKDDVCMYCTATAVAVTDHRLFVMMEQLKMTTELFEWWGAGTL